MWLPVSGGRQASGNCARPPPRSSRQAHSIPVGLTGVASDGERRAAQGWGTGWPCVTWATLLPLVFLSVKRGLSQGPRVLWQSYPSAWRSGREQPHLVHPLSAPEVGRMGRHRSSSQALQPPLRGLFRGWQPLFQALGSNSLDRCQWPWQVLLCTCSAPPMAQSLGEGLHPPLCKPPIYMASSPVR